MANRFILNETSYHGAGAIRSIADEVRMRKLTKAFVCSDPDLLRFQVTQKVTAVLEEAGLAYEMYSDIKPNPTIENVQNGVKSLPGFRRGLYYRHRRRLLDGYRQGRSALLSPIRSMRMCAVWRGRW